MMQTLFLEPGDLVRIKSTDLPSGQFIKLQAQSTSFLDISDPKAVLENAFRNFSCLTKGDVFTFAYNDQTYEMAVLETKPEGDKFAVSVLETDLEVDFAPPLGYEEPKLQSGTSTPSSLAGGGSLPTSKVLHSAGTMAQAINYASIAPNSTAAAAGAKAVSSNFLLGGQKLSNKKGGRNPTPKASTPVAGTSTNNPQPPTAPRRTNGPQPLRLPPGKLFFGYEIKSVQKKSTPTTTTMTTAEKDDDESKPRFPGQGQTLRGKRKSEEADAGKAPSRDPHPKEKGGGGGGNWAAGGRTLRDASK